MLSLLVLHGKERVEEVSKSLSARGDGSGKWKRRDVFRTSQSQSPLLCTQVATGVFVETTDSLPAKALPTLYDLKNVGVR